MPTNRKIITYIATSADGYIARPDGDVDWLNRRLDDVDYGMKKFYAGIDTILWGRKTYDWVIDYHKELGTTEGIFDRNMQNFAFSRYPPTEPIDNVTFVDEPIEEFAHRLRETPGTNIWMMGGAGLIASFLDAGEIDEFDIHVIPVMIGEGIPLVAPRHRDIELNLRSSKQYPDGVVRLRYEVGTRRED